MAQPDFHQFLPELDAPRLAAARGLPPRQYAELVRSDPIGNELISRWAELYSAPFHGITTNGVVRSGLFPLQPAAPEDAAPTEEMVARAATLLKVLGSQEHRALRYSIDAHEWRSWSNPEFIQHDTGVRLEEISEEGRLAVLDLIEASLSPEGFRLARELMLVNDYLGRLVDLPTILNEWSYHFALYGEPSLEQPWGWSLFGHHVALNCFVVGTQLVVSPVFFGAEPSSTDDADHGGQPVLHDRADAGLALLRALPDSLRDEAILYHEMRSEAMPPGRYHIADQRHLAGAFQDNRVIPVEGVSGDRLPPPARQLLGQVARTFLGYLPHGPLNQRLAEFEHYLDETWFCWIGGTEPGSSFYFRVQSPVIILEFDHHSGVFLTNEDEQPFHIHTIVRTPNGNDYGRALLAQASSR